jgi:hypothetical protein
MVVDFSTKHLIFERRGNGVVGAIMGSGHTTFLNLLTNLVQRMSNYKEKITYLVHVDKVHFHGLLRSICEARCVDGQDRENDHSRPP